MLETKFKKKIDYKQILVLDKEKQFQAKEFSTFEYFKKDLQNKRLTNVWCSFINLFKRMNNNLYILHYSIN